MKLNLGCGEQYWEGYKNIDISNAVPADQYYDINHGIKEKNNSVDEIHAGCVLEQVDDFVFVLNECWRVLKKNGTLKGYVPSTASNVLFVDPMDKRFFTEESFQYFNVDSALWKQFGKTYGFKPWQILLVKTEPNGIIHFELMPTK